MHCTHCHNGNHCRVRHELELCVHACCSHAGMQYIAQGLLIGLSSINHMTHVRLLCFIVGLVTGFSNTDHLTQLLYF